MLRSNHRRNSCWTASRTLSTGWHPDLGVVTILPEVDTYRIFGKEEVGEAFKRCTVRPLQLLPLLTSSPAFVHAPFMPVEHRVKLRALNRVAPARQLEPIVRPHRPTPSPVWASAPGEGSRLPRPAGHEVQPKPSSTTRSVSGRPLRTNGIVEALHVVKPEVDVPAVSDDAFRSPLAIAGRSLLQHQLHRVSSRMAKVRSSGGPAGSGRSQGCPGTQRSLPGEPVLRHRFFR